MNRATAVGRLAATHRALLAICVLFLFVAALTLDDYPAMWDGEHQRAIGKAALDYLAGDGERAFDQLLNSHDRYYGAAFEAPLVLVERILGLDDRRDIYLSRYLLGNLFFLGGGVFCYLLVYRLFTSRALALVAMVLFLLHPRIYAHSFLNSKDVPFLAMFMVSLYLVHRAFRRDTLAAFLLCGVGVGLLINLRIMGILLLAAVLAMRALDFLTANHAEERRRILLTGGAFALSAILTFHASLPVLWPDPFGRFTEMVQVFGAHPRETFNLFRGQWFYSADGPPFDYIPVWVGVTTPPATLLLALIGAVTLAWRGARRPRDIPRNGSFRFGIILLLVLPIVTVAAIVILENPIFNGWRQLFFLYAPLPLLAAFGLQRLISPFRGRWTRAGAYVLTGAAMAVTIVSMARLHPFEVFHFTLLTDRTTQEQLLSQYNLRRWKLPDLGVFGDILDKHPSGDIFLNLQQDHLQLLPADDRKRLVSTDDFRSGRNNFYAFHGPFHAFHGPCPVPPGLYTVRIYASTVTCVVDPVAWFGGLRQRALATTPLSRFRFNAHRVGDVLVYLRDGCSPDDTGERIFLHVHPLDPADLPSSLPKSRYERMYGFENRDFTFSRFGVRIDGDCIAVAPLPDYPIARIHTGQYSPAYAETVLRSLRDAEPLVRSRFDIHLDPDARTLTYVRHRCSAVDAASRFFLHLLPLDARDLPHQRRTHGFDNLNFSLHDHGARTDDGRCATAVPIPRYPIASIHTGQFDDRERLWETAFDWPGGE